MPGLLVVAAEILQEIIGEGFSGNIGESEKVTIRGKIYRKSDLEKMDKGELDKLMETKRQEDSEKEAKSSIINEFFK